MGCIQIILINKESKIGVIMDSAAMIPATTITNAANESIILPCDISLPVFIACMLSNIKISEKTVSSQ